MLANVWRVKGSSVETNKLDQLKQMFLEDAARLNAAESHDSENFEDSGDDDVSWPTAEQRKLAFDLVQSIQSADDARKFYVWLENVEVELRNAVSPAYFGMIDAAEHVTWAEAAYRHTQPNPHYSDSNRLLFDARVAHWVEVLAVDPDNDVARHKLVSMVGHKHGTAHYGDKYYLKRDGAALTMTAAGVPLPNTMSRVLVCNDADDTVIAEIPHWKISSSAPKT